MTRDINEIIDEMAERYELVTILNCPVDTETGPFDGAWMEISDDYEPDYDDEKAIDELWEAENYSEYEI